VLPSYALTCGEDCEAVVTIVILHDGSIADVVFERKSGSALFDQSVLRALKKADPLPPLPATVREGRLEVGLNFNP
jgi:TonB family protein